MDLTKVDWEIKDFEYVFMCTRVRIVAMLDACDNRHNRECLADAWKLLCDVQDKVMEVIK